MRVVRALSTQLVSVWLADGDRRREIADKAVGRNVC